MKLTEQAKVAVTEHAAKFKLRTEPKPGSHRTQTKPNPRNKGSFQSLKQMPATESK